LKDKTTTEIEVKYLHILVKIDITTPTKLDLISDEYEIISSIEKFPLKILKFTLRVPSNLRSRSNEYCIQ